MKKRTIAVFDFDGTLTTKDTLLEFIKFACGRRRFILGFLLYSPILVLMKLHLYPNWKAKQKVFAYFFKGWGYRRFKSLGQSFSSEIEKIRNESVIKKMENHIHCSDTVYVVSASISEWVRPWCEQMNVSGVMATEIEVDQKGLITGRFLTDNCYGQEKVNRLAEKEPDRESYCLYAYGDSRGDKELLEYADHGFLC
jgi:HAD superfamily hydrolase (TIGR01490 family)